jgi:hypothetical protein
LRYCLRLEKERAPVAGFFNGAEGDISPDWTAQDRDDAIHLAGRLATSVVGLLESGKFQTDANPRIEVRRKTVANNWRDTDGVGFASQPMAGAAELGGAEDGRTIFYNYGWRAEARKPAGWVEHGKADHGNAGQGAKEPGLDGPLASAVESLDGNSLARAVQALRPARFLSRGIFPALVPVTWARLGAFTLAAIPVEATTAAGWTIRQQTGADAIVGLANEYIGYTASAPEYQAQQYEGASTLLGPGQAAGLARLLALAAQGRGDPPSGDTVAAQSFLAGPRRKNAFGPETLLVRRRRNMVDEDLEPLLPRQLRRLEPSPLRWWNRPPPATAFDARQIAVSRNEQGWRNWTPIGPDFLTVLSEADQSTRVHRALIPPIPPPLIPLPTDRHRKQVCSQPSLAGNRSVAPGSGLPPSAWPPSGLTRAAIDKSAPFPTERCNLRVRPRRGAVAAVAFSIHAPQSSARKPVRTVVYGNSRMMRMSDHRHSALPNWRLPRHIFAGSSGDSISLGPALHLRSSSARHRRPTRATSRWAPEPDSE